MTQFRYKEHIWKLNISFSITVDYSVGCQTVGCGFEPGLEPEALTGSKSHSASFFAIREWQKISRCLASVLFHHGKLTSRPNEILEAMAETGEENIRK